jgi:hypothetical protein
LDNFRLGVDAGSGRFEVALCELFGGIVGREESHLLINSINGKIIRFPNISTEAVISADDGWV